MKSLVLPLMLAIASPSYLPDGTLPASYFDRMKRMADICKAKLPKEDPCKALQERIALARDCRAQETPQAARRREALIVSNFCALAYGRLPISVHKAAVDFEIRQQCVAAMAEYDITGSDANVLYAIADNLGNAVALSTAERDADLAAIRLVERHLYYTPEQIAQNDETFKRIHMRGALNPGPYFRMYWECLAEYHAREHYNALLRDFRGAAITSLYKTVANGYKEHSEDERRAIWDEFCRRARATEEEKAKAEASVRL